MATNKEELLEQVEKAVSVAMQNDEVSLFDIEEAIRVGIEDHVNFGVYVDIHG